MHACVACGLHAKCTQCMSLACLQHSCRCSLCYICVQVSVAYVQLECCLHGACIHHVCIQYMCSKLVAFLHIECLYMHECVHVESVQSTYSMRVQVLGARAACVSQVCDMCMACLRCECRVNVTSMQHVFNM